MVQLQPTIDISDLETFELVVNVLEMMFIVTDTS